jgi:hypothetical protein
MAQFLNSIPLLPSSYPGSLTSRNSTDTDNLLCPFYNTSAQTTRKTQLAYGWGGIFTAPLHSIGRGAGNTENTALLLMWAFISTWICLPSRCLAISVYSDFTIPAFGRHATVRKFKGFRFNRANHRHSTDMTSAMFSLNRLTQWSGFIPRISTTISGR